MNWDVILETSCNRLAERVCSRETSRDEREAAWQALLLHVAPFVESRVKRSRVLRRMRLNGVDEVRAVLVEVIARLRERDFANLRQYLARREVEATPVPSAEVAEEWDLIGRLTRAVASVDDEKDLSEEARGDVSQDTPFRGWIVNLARYAMMNHIRRRLGYRVDDLHRNEATARNPASDALPLDAVPEAATRPPLTDLLAMKSALQEIREFLAELPAPMGDAVWLWCEDFDFENIAETLDLEDAEAARSLVRAGNARLRHRFRGRWPELFPGAS